MYCLSAVECFDSCRCRWSRCRQMCCLNVFEFACAFECAWQVSFVVLVVVVCFVVVVIDAGVAVVVGVFCFCSNSLESHV